MCVSLWKQMMMWSHRSLLRWRNRPVWRISVVHSDPVGTVRGLISARWGSKAFLGLSDRHRDLKRNRLWVNETQRPDDVFRWKISHAGAFRISSRVLITCTEKHVSVFITEISASSLTNPGGGGTQRHPGLSPAHDTHTHTRGLESNQCSGTTGNGLKN